MENKQFKKKLIGGFDKSEVIDYIDRLQKNQSEEYDEEKYIEEIERLKEERDTLAALLEKANEQLKKLSDPLTGSNSMLASSITHSKAHFDNMASLSDEIRRETSDKLALVSKDAKKMLDEAVDMKKSFDKAAENLENDIEELRSFVEKSSPFFRDDAESIKEIRKKAVKEDEQTKTVLKQSSDLLDETVAHQAEIDTVLKKIKRKLAS